MARLKFKKAVLYRNYIIGQYPDKRVRIIQLQDNTLETLRLLSKTINFQYDETWTTRQFAAKLMTKINPDIEPWQLVGSEVSVSGYKVYIKSTLPECGTDGGRVVVQFEQANPELDSDIEAGRSKNTRDALRRIARQIGFEFKQEWTTQALGYRLINFIAQSQAIELEEQKAIDAEEDWDFEEEEGNDYVTDEVWQWWCSLSDSMKFALLTHDHIQIAVRKDYEFSKWVEWASPYEGNEDETWQKNYQKDAMFVVDTSEYTFGIVASKLDLDDRQAMSWYLELIVLSAALGLSQEYLGGYGPYIDIRDFEKLSYLENLEEFAYNDLDDGTPNDESIDQLLKFTKISALNLEGNYFTSEGVARLSALTNLEYLNISGNYEHDLSDAVEKLREALPDCEIISD